MAELALLDDDRGEVAEDDRLAIAESRGDDDRQGLLEALAGLGEAPFVEQHRRQLDEGDRLSLVVVVLAVDGDDVGEQAPWRGRTR